MKNVCKGPSAKLITVLFTIVSALLFIISHVDAALYDDFTNAAGIDETKWTIAGTGFIQPRDGYLYYQGTTGQNATLTSTELFSSGVFTMPFSNYFSDNSAPAGEGLGSVVALGLGSRDSGAWVRIERGQVLGTSIGQYIEVNSRFRINGDHWSDISVNYVQSDIPSGFLQLRYDDTNVTFFYRTLKTDPWTQMVVTGGGGLPVLDENNQTQPLVITPGWSTDVPIFIQAIPGGDIEKAYGPYVLGFKIDYVRTVSLAAHIFHNLRDIMKEINNLDAVNFKNANQQKTLINKLHAVVRKVKQESYANALDKLQNDILQKTNGCTITGTPDKNDWITDCDGQGKVYPLIVDTISVLHGLI
jgi:hypothetical protein